MTSKEYELKRRSQLDETLLLLLEMASTGPSVISISTTTKKQLQSGKTCTKTTHFAPTFSFHQRKLRSGWCNRESSTCKWVAAPRRHPRAAPTLLSRAVWWNMLFDRSSRGRGPSRWKRTWSERRAPAAPSPVTSGEGTRRKFGREEGTRRIFFP